MPSSRGTTLRSFLAVLWLFAALPQGANCQVFRGELVDAAGGRGIGGAMVSLTDRSGRGIERVLTPSSGRFQLRAAVPGEYRLVAERIGYATTYSNFFAVPAADTLTIELVARIEPISLAGVEAEVDGRRCHVRPGEGLAVAKVWEEARKALAAAAWTQERGLYRYEMLRIRRRLDDKARRVEREDRFHAQALVPAPFVSHPADSLLAEGFVRFSADGSEFWAPDADVLLSDFFVDTHCFRIKRHERRPEEPVGLEFKPVPDRQAPEISGTMWVHPLSAQLQRLDFEYVNLNVHPRLMAAAPGGSVEFASLPNGTWIVPSWHLRMFRPGRTPDSHTGLFTASLDAVIIEDGEVLRVYDEQDIVYEGDGGNRISGTVFDSLRVGLPGARVFLNGQGAEVVTDGDGRFELTHLGPWTYEVFYTHPYLENLWYQPQPVEVELGPGLTRPVRVDFELPSLGEVLDDVCGTVRQPDPTRLAGGGLASYEGVLTAAVTDVEGIPVAEAVVLIATPALREYTGSRALISGETSESGLHRTCWLPVDTPLEVVVLSRNEEFDRGALENGSALVELFPGRAHEITIAREAPYRTLLMRVEPR